MKIDIPHVAGCLAVRAVITGQWDSPWYLTGDTENRRRNGRSCGPKESGVRGVILGCNSTQCDGQAWVSENELLRLLEGKGD